MTFKKFIGFGILLWLFLAVIKVAFLKVFSLTNPYYEYVFWLLLVIFTISLSRRLGHINFLEAMLVAVFWFLVNLILDFIITSPFVGFLILGRWQVWVGYALMMLAIFFFHKKRHIQIRHEQEHHHH